MIRTLRLVIFILTCVLTTVSSRAQSDKYNAYINKYMSMAVEQMVRHRIPASITMAQALLESAAGTSRLAVQGNNHFGIKCGNSWSGPYMLVTDDAPNEHFRVYESVRQSYEDHSTFLRVNRRYAGLFQLKETDYRGWARGLKSAGYATSPTYAQNLIQIIENYELDKLDHLTLSSSHSKKYSEGKQASTYLRDVRACNRNFYTIAKAGDTFKSISKEMGVSEHKLRKYNEVDRHYVLQTGDIVYFEKKQKKAAREYAQVYHRMKEGESLYDLCQRYGMRIKTLYDINDLSKNYVPKVGELILLRK